MLALGVKDGRVMLVDEATGEEKWAVRAHRSYARAAISPGGRFVVSVGYDDQWKLWDVESGEVNMVEAMHDGTGACICEKNDLGKMFFQAACPVVAHNCASSGYEYPGYEYPGILVLALSLCGQRFATGGKDGAVILWDAQTGRAERGMQVDGHVTCLSFSADGVRLACGNLYWPWSIRVWDVATGALLRMIPDALNGSVSWANFSPLSSSILAIGGHSRPDDPVQVLNVDSGEKILTFQGRNFAEFSPDGRTIATARDTIPGIEGAVHVWGARKVVLVDAQSGKVRREMFGHLFRVTTVRFSVNPQPSTLNPKP